MKKTLAVLALSIAALASSQAQIRITEVAPWGSGTGPSSYAADWFELTNFGSSSVSLTNFSMDDDSNTAGIAPLLGITSIAAGESVTFLEAATATQIQTFRNTWALPGNVQIGTYTGSAGVGLSTGGDAVNIFQGSTLVARVSFATSTTGRSFDNAVGANNAAIATLSAIGTNGAYAAPLDLSQIGSPGAIAAVPEPATALFGLGLIGVAALSRRRTLALA